MLYKLIINIFLILFLPQNICSQYQKKPIQSNILSKPIKIYRISQKNALKACTIIPLKGELSMLGKQLFEGMSLFFNKIKNKKQTKIIVDLAILDIKKNYEKLEKRSDFETAKKLIKKLTKKSSIFISMFGADVIAASKDFTEQNKIASFFPIDGSLLLRKSRDINNVYFRPPYTYEIAALIHHIILNLNKKKIAIFHETSYWGQECMQAAESILTKHYNIKPVAVGSYQQATVNIATAVKKIASAAPDVILCIAQARPAYNFIQQILNKGLHATTFVGLSHLMAIQKTLKKSRGINAIISSVVPNPITSKLQIAKEYRADMKKYLPNKLPSTLSFEGYINALLFLEAIKNTKSPLTVKKVLKTISHIRGNYKGLELKFDKKSLSLSNVVWINKGSRDKWIRSVIS